jgi:hypothetical protein
MGDANFTFARPHSRLSRGNNHQNSERPTVPVHYNPTRILAEADYNDHHHHAPT